MNTDWLNVIRPPFPELGDRQDRTGTVRSVLPFKGKSRIEYVDDKGTVRIVYVAPWNWKKGDGISFYVGRAVCSRVDVGIHVLPF